jgi:hypothetical protein
MRLLLLVWLVLVTPCFAEVNLEKKNRVDNDFEVGYCAWCSIEMIGRHIGEKRLYNLAKNRSKESDVSIWEGNGWKPLPYVMVMNGSGGWSQERRNSGYYWSVYRKLDSLGVNFEMQKCDNYDKKLIYYAMRRDLPIAFAVGPYAWGKKKEPSHAMVLVDFNEKTIKYIDPNDISKVHEKPRSWFDKHWIGWLVLVEK